MILIQTSLTFVGLVLVAWSLRFVARQTRELSVQTELQARIAGNALVNDLMKWNFEIERQFMDDPALRAFFYGRRSIELANQQQQSKVETLALSYADLLNCAITSGKRLESHVGNLPNWGLYADVLLGQSPSLRKVLVEHPGWWPGLQEHARTSVLAHRKGSDAAQ